MMNRNKYLALGGLFVALHLLFVFISRLLPGSELILVIFLPLLSTIYALKFNKKEVIMFFIASFLLSFLFEPVSSLIYVLPALICGTVYGELRKSNLKELSLVYITSLSHSFSLLISFLGISLMFKEVNFFSIFSVFIKKEGMEFYVSVYLILILLGVLEAFLTHIITNSELKKLGYKELEGEIKTPRWMNVFLFISLIVYLGVSIINPVYSCYVFPFLLAFYIPNVVEFVLENKHKWVYLISGFIFFVSLFLLRYVNKVFLPGLILVILSPLILEKFVRVLYTISSKYSNNGKNKIE